MDLSQLRRDYQIGTLLEPDAPLTPWPLLERWLDEALALGLPDATAMTLATVGADGQPSARVVLLKGADASGLRFFTRYSTRKAQQLSHNPKLALSLHHRELDRQVQLEGHAKKLSREENEAYFATRPRPSQLGAHAASGLVEVASRAELEARAADADVRFAGQDVPLPTDWGGYRVSAQRVEFWQGRPSRLHDRLLYTLDLSGSWTRARLAP